MKIKNWIFLFIPFYSLAQTSNKTHYKSVDGIHFESGLTWNQIKSKAVAENKYIFMDCYTTWCGPCKFMSKEIFTKKIVGDYVNSRFISVAVQFDQTTKDNNTVKKWYKEAKEIAKAYSIHEYPTYLFFSPDGQPVHRFTGATGKEPNDFIQKVSEAYNPEKQYYYLVGNYKTHLQDSCFLRKTLKMCLQVGDKENSELISDALVGCLKYPFDTEDLVLIKNSLQTESNKGFLFFMDNATKIDSILHRTIGAEHRLSVILSNEEIAPLFLSDSVVYWKATIERLKNKFHQLNEKTINLLYESYGNEILDKEIRHPLYDSNAIEPVDWEAIKSRIKNKYPDYNPERLIAKEKPRYYLSKKMWPELDQSTLEYLAKYGPLLDKGELNDIAWEYVFMHSENHDLLSTALEYSRQTLPDSSESIAVDKLPFMDTYANLLYKVGEKEKAIQWETKAFQLANKYSDGYHTTINYEMTLRRMKSGEDTWTGRNTQYEEYQ